MHFICAFGTPLLLGKDYKRTFSPGFELANLRSYETPDCVNLNEISRHPATPLAAIMSLEAALNLSVLELLRALNKKLGLECTRTQEYCLPPLGLIPSLETEVSGPLSMNVARIGSNG